jgi:hypothetical protein
MRDDPYDSPTPIDLGPFKKRGAVKIMKFRDYDHDGHSTEFLLHVGALAGGRELGIVVGLTRFDPRLHTFGTVENPNHPLVLQLWEWDRLLHARAEERITLSDWPCDDHGSRFSQRLTIMTDADGIHVKKQQFDCRSNGAHAKLIFEEIE